MMSQNGQQTSCYFYHLCYTMACFLHEHYFSKKSPLWSLLFVEITFVSTTFCGDHPCEHYFSRRSPLWALHFVEITLVSTTFCGDHPCEHYFLRSPLWALLFVEITSVSTTFCGDHPCEHYFFLFHDLLQWVITLPGMSIVMSQWVMTLLSINIMP